MAIKQLSEDQVRTMSLEEKDRWWLQNVFRGDMPQLTLRSGLTGFFLGGILSATNLYVGAKTGWSLGVGITSVILAFAMFKILSAAGRTTVSRAVFAGTVAVFLLGVLAIVWFTGVRRGWFEPLSSGSMAVLGAGVLVPGVAVWRILTSPVREFTILENNAMQSIATSAGYMTAPLISSLSAYMILNDRLLPWHQIITWNVVVSILGVLFAFPLKRRFINDEQHPFPEGRAAGVVMDTLHSSDASVGMMKARALVWAGTLAGFARFLQAEGLQEWIQHKVLRLEESLAWFPGKLVHVPEQLDALYVWFAGKVGLNPSPKIAGVDFRQAGINPALDISLMGAGGLMGIRGGVSLMIGAVLNYCILAPWMISRGDIKQAVNVKTGALRFDDLGNAVFGFRQVTMWALWPGVACLVVASFVAFFAKPRVILGAFRGVLGPRQKSADVLGHIEFPLWISAVGIPVMSVVAAWLCLVYFGVPMWVTLVGLPLTFVLSLVAANSTALTSTTPVGATAKITQLFYGVVRPGEITTNIATAGITAEVVSNSSNLLMDIKPGYMLGAKPRQQAVGHVIGIFAGAIASTPLFFLLFTSQVAEKGVDSIQSDKFPMPSVSVWSAVARALTKGLGELAPSVQYAVAVGALVGLALEVTRIATRGRFLLSPVGLGLAFVINFQSSFSMFLGATFFWLMGVGRRRAEGRPASTWVENHEPICAGVIAGAALVGIADAIVTAFVLPLYH